MTTMKRKRPSTRRTSRTEYVIQCAADHVRQGEWEDDPTEEPYPALICTLEQVKEMRRMARIERSGYRYRIMERQITEKVAR